VTAAFVACGIVTAVSALVSLGFSIDAVVASRGDARTVALYALARSVALAAVAVFAPFTGALVFLAPVAIIMVIVQGADAVVGARGGGRAKTWGPAAVAAVNLAALVWLLST
jgi:hypothetical protein